MASAKNQVLDLGGCKQFKLEKCIKEKMKASVVDEGGLSSPLSVSLVIPTKFGPEESREIEEEALHKILSECSELVDAGYLDEIVLMGATQDTNGKPDFSVLQNVVRVAYEELGLFREQVNLLNRYGSQNERAKRGLMDFFVKVVHQFDENIPKVLAKYGVFGVSGYFGVPPGKGAGLWLSVPITQGDILCFVDSDVMNFKKQFINSLCYPIIYSWNLVEAAIKFVKAYYVRLTVIRDLPSKRTIFGGRVCRFLTIPLIRSVTQTLSLYEGLDTMKYPLAGEFAIARGVLEKVRFPNTYAVETFLLFQLFDLIGLTSMAQVDLQVYHHIGQSLHDLENMALQISASVFQKVIEKLGRTLTDEEKEQTLIAYQEILDQLIDECEKTFSNFKELTESGIRSELTHSRKDDEERSQFFLKVLKDVLYRKEEFEKQKFITLPSWSMVSEKTGNYFVLKELLRRRSNQSTWSRLRECKLIS